MMGYVARHVVFLDLWTHRRLETSTQHLKMDGWKLEDDPFLSGFGLFSGAKMLVSGRVWLEREIQLCLDEFW